MNQPNQNTNQPTPRPAATQIPASPATARLMGQAPRFNMQAPPRAAAAPADGSTNKPAAKFKAGAITATIWANAAKGATGEVTYHSVTLDRRYTDKQGQWQSSSSLRVNDLPKAALVLQKAYEYLVLREQEGVSGWETASGHAEIPAYGGIAITEEEVLIA